MEILADIWRDIGCGLRWLRRNPGFTVAAIMTMAVGIGANTCVFSVIESTLFFPLQYPHSDSIVSAGSNKEFTFESWHEHSRTFSAISAQTEDQVTLVGVGAADRLRVAKITSSFFDTLGVKPLLGRPFLPSETGHRDPRNAPHVAILSYALWRDHFGSEPNVLGGTIHLDNDLFTIIGVMSKDFEFPNRSGDPPDLFLPLNFTASLVLGPKGEVLSFSGATVSVLGRLRPESTMLEAQAELRTISQERVGGLDKAVNLVSLRYYLVGKEGSTLLIFWGAVGFVLLIACVNVANLMLGRAVAREKEIAVRVALGAHRWRVARQLLTEAVMLAAFGALVGIGIAYALVILVRSFGPGNIPRLNHAHINLSVLAFTVLVTGLAGLFAGLAPVRSAWRVSAVEALKEGPRTSVGYVNRLLRRSLAVAGIAIALILLTGAGLLVRSFLRLNDVPLHFDPRGLLTAQIAPPEAKYASAAQLRQFEESLLDNIEGMPGVRAVAVGERGPMMGFASGGSMIILGSSSSPALAFAGINTVTRGFFRATGIPVLEGREFLPTDTATSLPLVIVNQSFAKRFFRPGEALGGKIGSVAAVKDWKGDASIIGVVADDTEDESSPIVYLNYEQHPAPFLTVLIRTGENPDVVVSALRACVHELDGSLPVFGVMTMDQLLGERVARPRFEASLLGGFALIALLMATLGAYGVISYSVGQRTQEIGIRMALGAERAAVMRIVLGETLVIALTGVAIGMAGAFALTHYLQSMLYQIRPNDALSFAIAAGVLLSASLVAGFFPALRATQIDPIVALRYE